MCSAIGSIGGMVQEKGSRYRCSSWTVLHEQCTSALSSGFPTSQGNAEALDRWGGKSNHRMISYFLGNTSAKNYCNQIVHVKIIASQRGDVFWDTVYIHFRRLLPCDGIYPAQNSLYVHVLLSPILAALLHGSPAAALAKLCGVVQGMELQNFRRGRHLYSAGRLSPWTSAHILV